MMTSMSEVGGEGGCELVPVGIRGRRAVREGSAGRAPRAQGRHQAAIGSSPFTAQAQPRSGKYPHPLITTAVAPGLPTPPHSGPPITRYGTLDYPVGAPLRRLT